jgi:putative hemolysin
VKIITRHSIIEEREETVSVRKNNDEGASHRLLQRVAALLPVLCMAAFAGCASATTAGTSAHQKPAGRIANPASENCVRQGGALVIRKRGDGGEYGVCVFPDNRQCEEWAMFRGECPPGGIDVTGCVTEAARYCVISGGQYQTAGVDIGREGKCLFNNGRSCGARDYFDGKCSPR